MIALTRREVYNTMLTFEKEPDVHTPQDQLEDITAELFDSVGGLTGT